MAEPAGPRAPGSPRRRAVREQTPPVHLRQGPREQPGERGVRCLHSAARGPQEAPGDPDSVVARRTRHSPRSRDAAVHDLRFSEKGREPVADPPAPPPAPPPPEHETSLRVTAARAGRARLGVQEVRGQAELAANMAGSEVTHSNAFCPQRVPQGGQRALGASPLLPRFVTTTPSTPNSGGPREAGHVQGTHACAHLPAHD